MRTKLILNTITVGILVSITTLAVEAKSIVVQEATMTDGLIAVVNESPILKSELSSAIAQTKQQYQAMGKNTPAKDQLNNEVLNSLIEQQLQSSIVKQSGYRPSDAAINQRIMEISKAQGWNSLQELKKNMDTAGEDGYKKFRNNVSEQLSIQALQEDSVSREVKITEQEVDNFLESAAGKNIKSSEPVIIPQWHTRHILIKVDASQNNEQAKQKIDTIHKMLVNGDDFAKLAVNYSDDPGSAKSGGDLDWVNEGMMVPEFEAAMKNTPTTQVSEPFTSDFGWHILQVTETRKTDVTEKARRNMVKDVIYREKAPAAYKKWINNLKSSAYIHVFK